MTWRELLNQIKDIPSSRLDEEIQFFFNGAGVQGDELLLNKENSAKLSFSGPESHEIIKQEIPFGTPYIYVDEVIPSETKD